MESKKIHLPAKRMKVNEQGCIKLTKEAMGCIGGAGERNKPKFTDRCIGNHFAGN